MAQGSDKSGTAVERHVPAYRRMLERVKHELADPQGRSLEQSVESAKQEAIRSGELDAGEAEAVAGYVSRDLREAGRHLATSEHELRTWLGIDVSLVEKWLLDAFMQTADKTRLEWLQLEGGARKPPHRYHAGEVTGPGTLQCLNCGERQRFYQVAHIPACPNCGHRTFVRAAV